nr:ATP-binding protein [Actinacidiphila yanglinensis]
MPLRRSLLLKLLLLSALVSACSIAATAWLTVHTTAVAIRQEQGQALTDDARTYDKLLGYAATHHDWAGAAATVRELARSSGHRITLTDEQRRPLVDSAGPGAPRAALPAEASATVDALSVDTSPAARTQSAGGPQAQDPSQATSRTQPQPAPERGTGAGGCAPGTRCLDTAGPSSAPATGSDGSAPLASGTAVGSSSIDARAVGPFRLTAGERTVLDAEAQRTAGCLHDRLHANVQVTSTPSGRPVITLAPSVLYLPTDCDTTVVGTPTATEQRALAQLDSLVDTCLDRHDAPHVKVGLDFGWTGTAARTAKDDALTASCLDTARREQLAPYVAPPALLFVSSPQRTASTFLDLSAGNRARVIEVTGLVLLLTLAVTALAGTRMVRPLRALSGAARRVTDGDLTARVKVSAQDEIGRVAAAFNEMSHRREQAEGLRKAMVSDVAHELRTPLSNIRGWLEAAEDGLVVPDRALLSSLLDEAVLLQHVIDDLRDLSAADAGELRLRTERVDVVDLLAQVATAHRSTAESAGVGLRTTRGVHGTGRADAAGGPDPTDPTDATDPADFADFTDENRPFTVADPVRLRQAVGNLVSNAIRHTPRGGTVTLSAAVAGGRTVIEVADTGSGIAAADLPRVFDRFWRAEKSRSRQTGGSGLGLAIVRKLAEAHGGGATAASTPGEGSVFTITLPGGAPRGSSRGKPGRSPDRVQKEPGPTPDRT